MDPEHATYFARTNFRNEGRLVGIQRADRRSHVYIIGKTGTGKSTLLRTLIAQDLAGGEGCALFDPHGDLVEEVLSLVPPERHDDLVYLNTPDSSAPWHFNPLAGVPPKRRALAVAGMVEVFRKIWSEDWGPRLEHLLRNVIFTLLELPGASIGDVPGLLADRAFRRGVVDGLSNEVVRAFWRDEYEQYSPKFRSVVVAPLQNKVGAMLTDPRLRSILTAHESSFELQSIMDEGKVLLVNLAKGRIGEGPAALLGSLLVSHLSLAGLARAEQPSSRRRDFFVYLDEFQTFSTLSLATMLSELRKYHVAMVLAHQHFSQLQPDIRDAVIGNAGTLISFRLGARDAAFVAAELSPTFSSDDLIQLPNYRVYLKLLIDGQPSRPFSANTVWMSLYRRLRR